MNLETARIGLEQTRLKGLQRRVGPKPPSEKALLEQARKFEGFLLQMLLSSMRKTVQKSKLLDGGQAEEIFTGMFDQAIAEKASGQGRGIGLAEMIHDQLAPLVARARQAQTVAEGAGNGR